MTIDSFSNQSPWDCQGGFGTLWSGVELRVMGLSMGAGVEVRVMGCILGKQSKKAFPVGKSRREDDVLELIHADLHGLIRVESLAGMFDESSSWKWDNDTKISNSQLKMEEEEEVLVENATNDTPSTSQAGSLNSTPNSSNSGSDSDASLEESMQKQKNKRYESQGLHQDSDWVGQWRIDEVLLEIVFLLDQQLFHEARRSRLRWPCHLSRLNTSQVQVQLVKRFVIYLNNIDTFLRWLLDIRDGNAGTPNETDSDNCSLVQIPEEFCIDETDISRLKLVNFIYNKEMSWEYLNAHGKLISVGIKQHVTGMKAATTTQTGFSHGKIRGKPRG
ncbi:hypothetical protein Tco_0015041 [Tanacetum coccineum]